MPLTKDLYEYVIVKDVLADLEGNLKDADGYMAKNVRFQALITFDKNYHNTTNHSTTFFAASPQAAFDGLVSSFDMHKLQKGAFPVTSGAQKSEWVNR